MKEEAVERSEKEDIWAHELYRTESKSNYVPPIALARDGARPTYADDADCERVASKELGRCQRRVGRSWAMRRGDAREARR